MLYRKMENHGDELSILGFGCMRLPQKKGSPGEFKKWWMKPAVWLDEQIFAVHQWVTLLRAGRSGTSSSFPER